MKKLIILVCAALMVVFSSQASKAQETSKGLIISTTSESEVSKILETLKSEDPSTYRLTVTTNGKNGRKSSKVYGTADLGAIKKVGGKVGKNGGGYAADDIVVLVKNIVSGKEVQDAVISQLNTSLSKQAVKSVRINRSVRVL